MQINIDCDFMYKFSEGLALIIKNGKFGFVNENGEIVIPLQYENASFL